MSWWRKLFGGRKQTPYGLHPDRPVLCGGGIPAEIDFLERLRCPAGASCRFERLGSLKRTRLDYLDNPDVELAVSMGVLRRLGESIDPNDLPLDGYAVECECGEHRIGIFIDMYYRGPEMPIDLPGWTLAEGVSPAITMNETADCPYCGGDLRTATSKQCRHCMMDWHDPENIFRRKRKSSE